jgi:hypothetical protein
MGSGFFSGRGSCRDRNGRASLQKPVRNGLARAFRAASHEDAFTFEFSAISFTLAFREHVFLLPERQFLF